MDFITRKASTLNATFVHDFIRRYPTLAWNLRNDIIDVSHNAANIYRQYQAFQLLCVIVNQMPALGDQQQEILTFMKTLHDALVDFLTKACDEKLILTTSQMKDLFKLGLAAVRQTQRIATSRDTLQMIWRPGTWNALHKKVLSSERFKASTGLQTMCQQMTQLLQGMTSSKKSKIAKGETSTAASKRKADLSGNDGDVVATRIAKRKKVKAKD